MTSAAASAVTALAQSRRLLSNRERLAVAARAIEPLLNRLVFTGRQVTELLATGAIAARPRSTFASDALLRVLSTASLDRVAADLQRLGLQRGPHGATSAAWTVEGVVTLEVTYISGDDSDRSATWLEYASLLTVPVEVSGGLRVRVSGAPALLGLHWAAYRAGGEGPLESGELEDVIALVECRAETVREVAAAPPELRSFVATETRRFLEYDGVEHVIRVAIPGAGRLPALVHRVAERLRGIAALA